MRTVFALFALILVLAACATRDEDGCESGSRTLQDRSRAPEAEPAADFDALEDELLAAQEVRIGFEITSHGPFESDLSGELITNRAQGTRLSASGRFGGRPVDLDLELAADDRLRLRSGDETLEGAAPAAVREALLLGLTRMGLLHNLALLSGLKAPEGAAGGFRSQASCLCFAQGSAATSSFKIFFGGRFVADAELDLGSLGWPTERRQTVHFEGGSMTVVESYEVFVVRDRRP